MSGYARLPYAVRYLVALIGWIFVVAGTILARIALIPTLPLVWSRSAFGLAHTQETAQMSANYVDFYTRPLMKMPRADWRRLFGRRRSRCSEGSAAPSDELAEPRFLKKVGDDGA